MLEDILLQVNKPARYIGNEWNITKKDFNKSYIRFALSFPELYEVGMSNLGIRIIYGILNRIEDVVCERFFCVDSDMEQVLRNNHLEIFSIESRRRLKEFDIIGFSLGYELDYTNVLSILELGEIPLQSSSRDESYPLVIAGGPCVLNPEPMHEFFDLFILGEAEEVIVEVIDIYREYKNKFKEQQKISKQDLLLMFADIEGVYVPSLYKVVYNDEGKIEEFKPKIYGIPSIIKKRFLKDLDKAFFPLNWLMPYIQIVHDRITLEVMRGCPNRCRFCQARSQYFPFRQRSLKNLLNLACIAYSNTGYEEISLCGLSVSDYSRIQELVESLVNLFKEKMVSISLPSMKPKSIIGSLSSLIATVKKTGLTFAPEAATSRLRKILFKDFNTSDFFKAVEQAYACGWRHIKLYFMIGIPYEEEQDLDAIIDFASHVSELRTQINPAHPMVKNRFSGRKGEVNISINTLIPKPHTPFQWLRMEGMQSIIYKQNYLKSKIKNKKLKLSFHNCYMSFLEGVLSRGDRRLSQVILYAFNKGARFDGRQNYFRPDLWQSAFLRARIDPNFYLQEKPTDDFLPWDFLDTGINKQSLLKEFNVAIKQGKMYNQMNP